MEIIHETGSENGSIRGWFEKGVAAFGECKHLEAATCFGQVLKADPFNAKAYCKLSNVYWAQGKTEDALNLLTRALELQPGDRETLLACTDVFVALGKKDFAEEVLKSYLDKNPQDKEICCRLESLGGPADRVLPNDTASFFQQQGEIQFARGNISHAMACFEMAIEEDPRLADAHNDLGVIYLEAGRTAEALEKFQIALELRPDDAKILGNSARGLARASLTDAAITVFREYLRRSPGDTGAWQEFESLVRQGSTHGWSPDRLSDEVADIYMHAAEELGKAGDLAGAVDAIGRALKIKDETPESLYVLAFLHNALGQKKEAGVVLERALSIDPSNGRCSGLLKSLRAN